jgi:hypothetical protein
MADPRYQGGGISRDKFIDPTHTTVKYTVLRIADEVPPAELRAQFEAGKGAQYDRIKALGFAMDRDGKISRPDLGPLPIDIIHGDNAEYGWRDENAMAARDAATPPVTVAPTRVAMGLSQPALVSAVPDRWGAAPVQPRTALPSAMPPPTQGMPARAPTLTFQSLLPPPVAPVRPRAALMPGQTPTPRSLTMRDLLARGR